MCQLLDDLERAPFDQVKVAPSLRAETSTR